MKAQPIKTPISRLRRPPFENGDRLTQAEFHRRYKKCPPEVRAELIGGTVYMASPTRYRHGEYQMELATIFRIYAAATPGIAGGTEATVILGADSEPQPDAFLRILREFGGRTRLNTDQYLVGAPELLAEIAYSSVAIDLGEKKLAYEQGGVQEYMVISIEDQELHWFHFLTDRELKADRNGILKSKALPGLWIDSAALLSLNAQRSIEVVQQGIASADHAEFVDRLRRTRTKLK